MAKGKPEKRGYIQKEKSNKGAGTKSMSAFSMALASLCCVGPIALLALGLGSAALTASLVQNKWLFMGIGTASLSASYYLYFRELKRCRARGCAVAGARARKAFIGVATGVVIFFVVFSIYPYSAGSADSQEKAAVNKASVAAVPAVLYFWEPCPTCTVTNPAVRKLEAKYKGQADFRWVNLVSDEDAYPLARKYGVQAIPWLVFADGDGSVKGLLKGWFSFEDAERQLKGVILNGVKAR